MVEIPFRCDDLLCLPGFVGMIVVGEAVMPRVQSKSSGEKSERPNEQPDVIPRESLHGDALGDGGAAARGMVFRSSAKSASAGTASRTTNTGHTVPKYRGFSCETTNTPKR